MIDEILFGKDYEVLKAEEKENKIIINLKSKRNECKCPYCNQISKSIHSTYERNIQDTPLHCTETWLKVNSNKYDCLNEKCNCKTFVETLPFAKTNQVKTDALISLILGISIFLSNSSASLILSLLGVRVSADTIKNLYDRIEIIDNPDVEEIGIDDVATRKGQKYATAIYDMKDHHLIALLERRDSNSVKEWLKRHKKIKIVARDRANGYAKAISKILPNCIQVADKFHLLQNLLEYLKEIFKADIPTQIYIQEGKILEKCPKKIINLNVPEEILKTLNYDNSPPLDELGNIIKYDNIMHNEDDMVSKKREEAKRKKIEFIINVKERWKESKDINVIVNEYKISISTAKKYINMSQKDIKNLHKRKVYKKRKTMVDDYDNIIYKMLKDDLDYRTIYAYVHYKGYKGTLGALEHHIYLINKNNFPNNESKSIKFVEKSYPENLIIIKRSNLLKYILTINKKGKDKNIEDNIELLKEKYPIIKEVENYFKNFHSVIMSNDTSLLDQFLEIYENSKISTFCKGIKKDIAPIKNAISYNISSGFVEGNNNKFKLIKRIVYGKSKLVNLFRKCYVAFQATLDDFSLFDLL